MVEALLFICVAFLAPAGQQAAATAVTTMDVKDVVRAISIGLLEERKALLPQVLAADMTNKSPEVAAAIAAELRRMNAVLRQREANLRNGVDDPTAPDLGEYYLNLLEACERSKNPIVIPVLVEGMNGRAVWNALIEFGPLAADPVSAALESESDPLRLQGVAFTMAGLLRANMVRPSQRARVISAWHTRATKLLHPVAWRGLFELALATGEPGLRARVEAIANDNEMPETAAAKDAAIVRNLARRALAAEQARRQ